MKKQLVAVFCAVTLAVTPIAFNGCGSLTQQGLPTISAETSDQVILRAEQAAEGALLTFDTFVKVERDNEAPLKMVNPAIHDFANYIRRNGKNWIVTLRNTTKAFKANRTTENRASLNTILATLTSAVSETNKYIQQAKGVVKS